MGEGIQQLIGYAPHEVNGGVWKGIIQKSVMLGEAAGVDKDEAANRVKAGDLRHWRCDMLVTTADGKSRWISDASVQNLDDSGRVTGSVGILQDITERKQAEAELERAHRQLLDVSRAAGMAEVATSVLHNVGNVLNSVNTSAGVVMDCLKTSKADGVSRIAELFEHNRENLTQFLATDGRADQVINFLKSLAQRLTSERNAALRELQELNKNIEHIKDIVVMQQSYAKVSGVTEKVKPTDLVEDALRMNAGALARHRVRLVREYDPHLPEITVEKHKVLQILVNLIRNAKYACDESGLDDKCMTLRVTNGDDHVRISVTDNGVGIPAENLKRIFNHGFTTREHGHGFGLHSGALAAKEMGGELFVSSDGPGRGATFTVELPILPGRLAARGSHGARAGRREGDVIASRSEPLEIIASTAQPDLAPSDAEVGEPSRCATP
jgi:PAS domain S-box-containing protein